MNLHPCHSARRCNQIACETCAWRHAWYVTRKVLEARSGLLYAVTLTVSDPSPAAFRQFRVDMRNRIQYLRRNSKAWQDFGLHMYQCADGKLQGVGILGVLGPGEVLSALGGRWPITLHPLSPENLRLEFWRCMKPSVMAPTSNERGGYRAVRFSISPSRPKCRLSSGRTAPTPPISDAMPILVL